MSITYLKCSLKLENTLWFVHVITSSCSDQIAPAISSTQGIVGSNLLVPPHVWCDFILTAFKVRLSTGINSLLILCFYVALVEFNIKQTPVATQAGDNSIDSGAVLQLEAMKIQGSPPGICASSPNASPQATDCSLDDNTCIQAASQDVENAGAMTNRHDSINSKLPPPQDGDPVYPAKSL